MPKTFFRNKPTASHPGLEIGFIADDMNEIFPELVEYEADGKTPRGINYEGLTAPLAGAIQYQNGLLEDQQEQINDLQKQINTLKTGHTPGQSKTIVILSVIVGGLVLREVYKSIKK